MDIDKRNLRDPGPRPVGRRTFLRGSLVGGAAFTAVAAAGPSSFLPTAVAQTGPSKFPSPDEMILGAMQTIEKATVNLYQSAMAKISDPSVTDTASTYMEHHKEQALALGTALRQTATQSDKIEPNAPFAAAHQPTVAAAADQTAALQALLTIEQVLTATYLEALMRLEVGYNAEVVATILAVDAQHGAVLATLLEQPLTTVLPAEIPAAGAVDLTSSTVLSSATTTTTTAPTTAAAGSTTTTQAQGPTP